MLVWRRGIIPHRLQSRSYTLRFSFSYVQQYTPNTSARNTASMHKFFSEKNIHLIFDISLLIKGFDAILETIAGALAFFVTQKLLIDVIQTVAAGEIAEDPRDFVVHTLLQLAHQYSTGTQYFVAIYLVIHGAVKLWLVIGLLRKKLWYYPTALVVFFLFIVYQLYQFSFNHSVWLLILTVLDVIVIMLTIHEYRYLRSITAKNTL